MQARRWQGTSNCAAAAETDDTKPLCTIQMCQLLGQFEPRHYIPAEVLLVRRLFIAGRETPISGGAAPRHARSPSTPDTSAEGASSTSRLQLSSQRFSTLIIARTRYNPMAPIADKLAKPATLAARAVVAVGPAILLSRRDLHVNSTQKVTLGIIAVYVVAIALLWNIPYVRWVLWPFKVSSLTPTRQA